MKLRVMTSLYPLIVLLDTQDRLSSLLDSDMDLSLYLEGLDLVDYLRDRVIYDAIDAAAGLFS